MTILIHRRAALRAMTSALAAGAVMRGGAAFASMLPTAFSQALAAAAGNDTATGDFYRNRDYQTVWTGPQDAPRREILLQAFDSAGDHGLPTPRYDSGALRQAFANARTEGDLGRLEIAMTQALLAYARDLSSGALEPGHVEEGIKRVIVRPDPALILQQAVSGDLASYLASLVPQAPEYGRLMVEKFALEGIVAAGGFGSRIAATEVKPGASGAAVVALRDRLMALGYLERSFSETYDSDIQAAVQRFQLNSGITPDGTAGKETVEALNTSAADRLKSVVVAMERLRWMGNAPLGSRHIWVNQPDFSVKVVDDGAVTFESKVVIGKVGTDTESPEFSDVMEFMVINPTWSVPRSIVVKEYLPQFQRNPEAQGQLQLLDRSGHVVDRSQIDFTAYTPNNFPFALRQPPEDGNALGKVKFMFPNQYNIYLHDTPSKSLFAREVRAFSHGCIRVAAPFDLAYCLLARQTDDPQGLFAKYLKGGRESVLNFDTPIPVHLVYFTAWPNDQGGIGYRRDIYGRDAKLFAALKDAGVVLPGDQS
ncbi:L,D-transpeptidase family protein [bacterium]|nr:L,D-transpeptidase family protein [bacterium]